MIEYKISDKNLSASQFISFVTITEPVWTYFTRFLRVLTFCLEVYVAEYN